MADISETVAVSKHFVLDGQISYAEGLTARKSILHGMLPLWCFEDMSVDSRGFVIVSEQQGVLEGEELAAAKALTERSNGPFKEGAYYYLAGPLSRQEATFVVVGDPRQQSAEADPQSSDPKGWLHLRALVPKTATKQAEVITTLVNRAFAIDDKKARSTRHG